MTALGDVVTADPMGRICSARLPSAPYRCTLDPDHTGPHSAGVIADSPENLLIVVQWLDPLLTVVRE